MPIFFPDILENNNPNFPLVDATFLKGNSYPLASIDATGSIPSNKRNVGLIIFDSGSQEFYAFKGATVADWDIDQAVFTGDGDGRFGAIACQRVKPRPPPSAHDQTED